MNAYPRRSRGLQLMHHFLQLNSFIDLVKHSFKNLGSATGVSWKFHSFDLKIIFTRRCISPIQITSEIHSFIPGPKLNLSTIFTKDLFRSSDSLWNNFFYLLSCNIIKELVTKDFILHACKLHNTVHITSSWWQWTIRKTPQQLINQCFSSR